MRAGGKPAIVSGNDGATDRMGDSGRESILEIGWNTADEGVFMAEIRIEKFTKEKAEKWDGFVLNESMNGTFLQTRNFLNYHPDGRFHDCSIMIYKGTSDLVAVVPACAVEEKNQRIFLSHAGSTFGGILFSKRFYNLQHVEKVMDAVEIYLKNEGFYKIIFKQPSQIFSRMDNDLSEYFFFCKGYIHYSELSFVIDLTKYSEDVLSEFSSSRRRDYRYAQNSGLEFRELDTKAEIAEFYHVLLDNLKKFGTKPVHTLEELYDFKWNRLCNTVKFYGVYHKTKLLAGSMVFLFGNEVFHTQYLAAAQDDLKMFPNNYLDTNLIMLAKSMKYRYFSFGISTEEHGKVLNHSLAEFKEGFGTGYSNNKTWYKVIG